LEVLFKGAEESQSAEKLQATTVSADTFPVKTTQLKHLKKIVLARGAPQAIGSMTLCSSPLKK
jgi:hypothetical protein